MDILGRKAEQAEEEIQTVEQKIDKLESHLNAVDSALQDFVDNYSSLMEQELDVHEDEILRLQEIIEQNVGDEETIKDIQEELDERTSELEEKIENQQEELEALLNSDLEKNLATLIEEFGRVKDLISGHKQKLFDLEDRVDDIESELLVEVNNRDFDFDQKLDKREFEDEKEYLEEEVKKLRASVNVLAEELDKKDDIEVE